MAKYNKEVVKMICGLIEKDSHTISEICAAIGIGETTYYRWQTERPDFNEALNLARQKFDQLLVVKAKRSLMRKIEGYTEEEIKTVYVPSKKVDAKPTIKEKTVTKKHFQPDTASIIFLLTNKAADEYKHRQTVDAKVALSAKVGELSEEQLNQVIDQILTAKQ